MKASWPPPPRRVLILDLAVLFLLAPLLAMAIFSLQWRLLEPWLGGRLWTLQSFLAAPYGAFFVGHPARAALFACVLAAVFVLPMRARHAAGRSAWPFLLPVSSWLWYGLWEFSLLGQGADLRIELPAMYSVLTLFTVAGFLSAARLPRR